MIEIAIDGTAASGKGTLAKKLANKYGFAHLDTGLLYRKVADELIIKKKDTSTNLVYYSTKIARDLNFLELKKEDLRSEKTAKLASLIATYPKLREILNSKQKEFVIKMELPVQKKFKQNAVLFCRSAGAGAPPTKLIVQFSGAFK
mgnify:CR=1 FL=1